MAFRSGNNVIVADRLKANHQPADNFQHHGIGLAGRVSQPSPSVQHSLYL
jgi:hypothetical protein